jgi:NAD(P)-dependent dehydrogenase (short-subunit alcohol dehydrogenase family)/SAM-dependent methyltransferase
MPVMTGSQNLALDLGTDFQGINEIRRTDGEALCRMALPESLSAQKDAYRFIHPAFLDSCFHALGVALPNAGAQLLEAYLLLGLDHLRFFENPAGAFWNHIKLRGDLARLGAQETFAADIHLYSDEGQLIAELNGISLKRARPEMLFRSQPDRVQDMLYKVEWLPQPHPAQLRAAKQLSSPTEIEAYLAARVDELSTANRMSLYDEMLPRLDQLGGRAAAEALQKLGMSFTPGRVYRTAELTQKLGIVSRQASLFSRLLEMLAEDGLLKQTDAGWEVLKPPEKVKLAAEWEGLIRQFPMFKTELTLTARCTGGLAEALIGKADPLELLFPGGSMADAEKLYQDAPVARTYNTLVRDAVATALKQAPSDKKLRILEIGGGTGGTTSYILPALPAGQTQYVFTDVSPLFTKQAANKFSEYDFVEYQPLDISRDPASQGFERHSFDLVIAANVLHATPDLRQTLQNVKSLLAPQGELILYEATGKQRFSDLTVGLTEGWWSFTDKDLRPSYALLTQEKWRQFLGEMGFVETVAVPGSERSGILSQQTVIVARAAESVAEADSQVPWLILADEGGTGKRLADALQGRGQQDVLVVPNEETDFVSFLKERSYRGVIYLRALDNKLSQETTAQTVNAAQQLTTGNALRLAQAMINTNQSNLWLVTRGAQAVAGDTLPAAAGQAAVLGLGRTIALEHPELHCKRIDLNPHPGNGELEDLASEILQPDGREEEIAFRDSRRARRLVRAEMKNMSPITFRSDASYLITGGLRGIGLLVAEWMAERGAKHLVLMGRNSPSAEAQKIIDRLTQAGANILAMQGDVSCEADIAKILAEAEKIMPPLQGIIHSAGVLADKMLMQQDWSRFETVMAPKVSGTWHLHHLTRHMSLDFFVLFSSGVAILGAAGQSNHASANTFMDGFAAYRRALGLPALSINWGAWAEVGAAADRNLADSRNVATFTPQAGLQALEWAMQQDLIQVGVLPADWNELLKPYPIGDEPPLFREIARQVRRRAAKTEAKAHEVSLSKQLAETVPNKRKSLLLDHIRQKAAQVLSIANANTIDVHQPLQSMGLDSLMAVELRNRLGQSAGKTLPATLLFEYPTISALTDYLASEVFMLEKDTQVSDISNGKQQSPEASTIDTASLDEFSDDELAAMLRNKLGQLNSE